MPSWCTIISAGTIYFKVYFVSDIGKGATCGPLLEFYNRLAQETQLFGLLLLLLHVVIAYLINGFCGMINIEVVFYRHGRPGIRTCLELPRLPAASHASLKSAPVKAAPAPNHDNDWMPGVLVLQQRYLPWVRCRWQPGFPNIRGILALRECPKYRNRLMVLIN